MLNLQCRNFDVGCWTLATAQPVLSEGGLDVGRFRRSSHHSDRLGWTVSRNSAKGFRFHHARASIKASDLEYGTEDHNRFRYVVQQRPGDDRGALAFWRGDQACRGRYSSSKHCPFDGRVHRWFHASAIKLFEHVLPDSIRRDLAGSGSQLVAATRFFEAIEVGIFHSALRRLSGIESGA